MGLLLDTRSGRLIALSARTLVGRSAACDVRLDDPRVSAEHAAIAWSGEHWELRDLGSLNGTWLDGRRLGPGERAPVRRDARLGFGGGDGWIVADDQAVGPAARCETTSELVHSTSGILALPSTSDPQATIFRRADGQWLRKGLPADEQGWIYAADLADMLRYTAERVNLEIFRARSLLAKLGFADSTHLIERRPGSRQLRIGVARLRVMRS